MSFYDVQLLAGFVLATGALVGLLFAVLMFIFAPLAALLLAACSGGGGEADSRPAPRAGGKLVVDNNLSLDKDTYEGIKQDALDPYLFVRDAFAQYRQNLVDN